MLGTLDTPIELEQTGRVTYWVPPCYEVESEVLILEADVVVDLKLRVLQHPTNP